MVKVKKIIKLYIKVCSETQSPFQLIPDSQSLSCVSHSYQFLLSPKEANENVNIYMYTFECPLFTYTWDTCFICC